MGDGIGNYNNIPVFVPKSAIGDLLKVKITSQTKEAIRAEITEIISPSSQRIPAICPHFSSCGGCSMQQLAQPTYQQFKERIAINAIHHAGFDMIPNIIFLPHATRRRTEFKLLKENNQWSLAYIGMRSHNKIAIHNCLILEPELQNLLPLLQELLSKLSFINNIETVALTLADSGIEIILTLDKNAKLNTKTHILNSELQSFADALKLTRMSLIDYKITPIAMIENNNLTMRLGRIDINLPQDAFLQATSEGQKLLTEFTKNGMTGNKKILDLFCGIGTYSVTLAENTTVHAADDHQIMIENLRHAARSHHTNLTAEKRNLFTTPFSIIELNQYDGIIINPPRSGAKAQCEQIALSDIKSVVMISCNPATFARDAKILKNAGFQLKNALAIDQFVWSPHLEIAVNFTR